MFIIFLKRYLSIEIYIYIYIYIYIIEHFHVPDILQTASVSPKGRYMGPCAHSIEKANIIMKIHPKL